MELRTKLIFLGIAGVVAVAAASVAVATRDHPPKAKGYTISTHGRRVHLSKQSAIRLGTTPAKADAVYLLGTKSGRALYRIGSTGYCFANGSANAVGNLGAVVCTDGTQPVIDLSIYDITQATGLPTVFRAEGIAVDGIATIVYVNSSATVVARAPVSHNVFRFPTAPRGPVAGIEALDVGGNVVYSRGFHKAA